MTKGVGEPPGYFRKCHTTSEEAFNCHSYYLTHVQGYKRVGSREFSKPGEARLILTKRSRFGGILRGGKPPSEGGTRVATNRATPKIRMGGVIIG